jgi:hypothetical protein
MEFLLIANATCLPMAVPNPGRGVGSGLKDKELVGVAID